MKKTSILFCCMGNICRSPTAEGVFRALLEQHQLHDQLVVDSAGTHAYHVGEPPDTRAQAAALRRGIDLSRQRARRVASQDFDDFDYILAMDRDNHAILLASCPAEHQHKVHLLLDFAPHLAESEVPDPYYGGANGFDVVLDLIEAAATGLLQEIRRRQDLS